MDEHEHHHQMHDIARIVVAISALIIAICFAVAVFWMVSAQSNAKLFEADNYVCYSQPFAIECHPRTKP